ncbi:MAG: EFR1 family ferrodoxin [Oscillospiraceae bacterium]|nr:EFR1 family ferrodoxin [Oscillospiraceae bacterium]
MVTLYYFSPTGGTKKVAEIFSSEIAGKITAVDLGMRTVQPESTIGDVAVIAAPVFGGRIPAIVADKVRSLNGTGKKAVTLAVYGNRAFEDALLELNDAVASAGFQIVASGAFVAQHSMAPEVGKGRPDEKDRADICGFAQKVLAKLESAADSQVTVPGNRPYKNSMGIPAAPISNPACKLCGKCSAVCPVGAISLENHSVATNTNCILCMACVSACPEQARILPPPLQAKMEQMLGALKSIRRENEYFL